MEDGQGRRSANDLLKEYDILVKLYMHEDNLALKIFEVAILLNSVAIALVTIGLNAPEIRLIAGAFGIFVCFAWRLMAVSTKHHHDLRAFRAREIETEMRRIGTFHDEAAVFHYGRPVAFHDLHDEKPQTFEPVRLKRVFAQLEWVPIAFGIVWGIFIVKTLIDLIGKALQSA